MTILLLLNLLSALTPPVAAKFPQELTIHGDTRIDDYHWMNHRDDELVLSYLLAENTYRDSAMAHTQLLRETLYQEMTDRLADAEISVPYLDKGYLYRKVYNADADYPIYQRKPADSDFAVWTTILDVNDLSGEAEYVEVDWLAPSPDNHLLSFSMDTTGNYEYDIRFINLITGKVLTDRIPGTWGSCIWSHDSKVVYFNVKDPVTNRVGEVKKHRVGYNNSSNKTVYFETDSTYSAYISQSMSGRFLYIACESTTSSEYQLLDLSRRNSDLKVFYPRDKDHLYYPYHHEEKFYILSNLDGVNFKLLYTHLDSTEKVNWREVLPYDPDISPEHVLPFRDYLVIKQRENGLPGFNIIDLKQDTHYSIPFDEVSYHTAFSENHEYNADFFRFEYSSPKTPDRIYDFHFPTMEKTLKFQKEIEGHFDPEDYTLERQKVKTDDGTIVPLTVVINKHFFTGNGENPSVLYGYGSYGSNMDAYFMNSVISLLDRGVIFAIAHVRGGGDLGRQWYIDGKMLQKMNTFTDFIACADYLVDHQYSRPDIMFAEGMSAGGLLMGAVSNLAPEKFKGIIAEVPYVDVITTMLDPSIPLTTLEYEEWGDPHIPQYYDYLKSYSPYDNVTAKDYPAMFITASYNDSQVQYWEPAKWAAKLRELKTDNNLLILSTDLAGSHEGASGRFSPYELIAMQQAFILDQAGYPYKGRPQ